MWLITSMTYLEITILPPPTFWHLNPQPSNGVASTLTYTAVFFSPPASVVQLLFYVQFRPVCILFVEAERTVDWARVQMGDSGYQTVLQSLQKCDIK